MRDCPTRPDLSLRRARFSISRQRARAGRKVAAATVGEMRSDTPEREERDKEEGRGVEGGGKNKLARPVSGSALLARQCPSTRVMYEASLFLLLIRCEAHGLLLYRLGRCAARKRGEKCSQWQSDFFGSLDLF